MNIAPELATSHWFNTEKPLTLKDLRGKVVVIEAFQMLCPGCVSHGLPQAQRIAETFSSDDVVVLGLHTVFEHHNVQGRREALEVFLHEYKINFPVAMDAPSEQAVPKTMAAYRLRGTPTLLLIDQQGRLRKQAFGSVSDLGLGAEIMALVQEPVQETPVQETPGQEKAPPMHQDRESDQEPAACGEEGCPVPAVLDDAEAPAAGQAR